ncbi:hypothetical protein F4778DRAFT_671383 [Xylariomycetidae sp. FL2044]|nr:hypothetical protein F4778DRAFT_671383 [Xylariomycetidae sp. FL2044]
MASSLELPSRPTSIQDITAQAKKFNWDPSISLKFWLRTAQTLYNEGQAYLDDRNLTKAYLLYYRYSILALDHLSNHPEAKTPEGNKSIKSLRNKTVLVVLDRLERIKPLLEEELAALNEAAAKKRELRSQQDAGRARSHRTPEYEEFASRDPALSPSADLLDAGDHQELAVDLAQEEIKRRNADRRASRIPGGSRQEEQARRTAGIWNNWDKRYTESHVEDNDDMFRRDMESTRRQLHGDDHQHMGDVAHGTHHSRRPDYPAVRPSTYNYPRISKPATVNYDSIQPRSSSIKPLQPARPPKEHIPNELRPPVLPRKEQIYPERTLQSPEGTEELPTRPPKIADTPDLPVKRKPAPVVTFRPNTYLENGDPLRSVFLPRQLRSVFLSVASENTRRGLEMCGILCGNLVNNALFVSCLLIPEQKCTSDTCETENEDTMLEYCMNEDLIVLGWIHTHPTQTCFMSSRDLHTQSGYQAMMPESIAIVCAPKFEPSYGIFRLTNPPGLPHILQCREKATFHQHSVDDLYTSAEEPPGHVYENDKLEFTVHDLRPGARNNGIVHQKHY